MVAYRVDPRRAAGGLDTEPAYRVAVAIRRAPEVELCVYCAVTGVPLGEEIELVVVHDLAAANA